MNNHNLRMMMLTIDGVLSQYSATPTDLLAAAQAIATSAIGDLTNKSHQPSSNDDQTSDALHRFADLAADQIRAALHQRIDEGPKPDW